MAERQSDHNPLASFRGQLIELLRLLRDPKLEDEIANILGRHLRGEITDEEATREIFDSGRVHVAYSCLDREAAHRPESHNPPRWRPNDGRYNDQGE